MKKSLWHGLTVLLVFSTCTTWGEIHYASRNINWGNVVESDVSRETIQKRGLGLASATPDIVETRILTLASGSKIKIRERIIENTTGGEDRIFIGGEQLSEIRVVANAENAEEVVEQLRAHHCSAIKRYGRAGRIIRARVPYRLEKETQALLNTLTASGSVHAEYSQVKFYVTTAVPATQPNDTYYSSQWALRTIGVSNVWARGYYGYPNIPCAVFDTGVHLTHEDLQINVKRRISALHSSSDPEDHHGHGSHCLGIMGADGNNGKGITGVGQVANLTSIRGPISYWEEGDDILDGFQWALDNGIKILSCSFGTPPGAASYDAAECAIINDLGAAGCLVVIAAGNDGNDNDRVPGYPSSYDCDNIIAVVCTNEEDRPANREDNGWMTSYGAATCDIGAPGTDILSCIRDADNAYEAWSGTSMATPLVAACAAMIWERNPSWTYRDVRDRLYATAKSTPALAGYCKTGARVDLDRALDPDAGFITLKPLPRAFMDGEEISLTITASPAISRVSITLMNRDDNTISNDCGTFDVIAGGTTNIVVWTPQETDKKRGYTFRVVAENDVAAFAYSSIFRVRRDDIPETISVSAPQKDATLDADNLPITFTASDAVYVDLAIEYLSTNDTWELETTLGDATATPGVVKTVFAHLVGQGWIDERPYRIVVSDMDDASIFGVSEPFYITRSTGSVYLMPGNPGQQLGESDATWKTSYEADTEIRVTCWMPDVSLYWFYLVPTDGSGIKLLKETWVDQRTDLENGVREYRTFSVAIPDTYADGRTYYLRFFDAFAPEMLDYSTPFTITPRADNKKSPTIAEAMGDTSGREYNTQFLWYPEVVPDGSWMLRNAWVGQDEVAWFETTIDGPTTLRYDVRVSSLRDHGVLSVGYAKPPILESSVEWTTLATHSGERDWQAVTNDIPEGTWTVRWTYARDSNNTVSGDNTAWLKDIRFLLKAEDVKINLSNNKLSISGGMAWPGFIVYTLDGSEPTIDKTRWVPGQSLTLHQSTLIRARAFKVGIEPGSEAQAYYTNIPGEGTLESPYCISTVTDLQAFMRSVNRGTTYHNQHIVLTQDIDCSGYTLAAAGYADEAAIEGARNFKGTFNGQGYTLFNPTFSGSGTDLSRLSIGLFGKIDTQGVVSNLVVRHPTFALSARDAALASAGGSIAAYNAGLISNCIVLDADLHLTATLGGIAGFNIGVIEKCFFSGKLFVQQSSLTEDLYLGGIAGNVESYGETRSAKLDYSLAHTEMTVIAESGYDCFVGGIAGWILNTTIINCGATSSLTNNAGRISKGIIFGRRENSTADDAHIYGVRTANGVTQREGTWTVQGLGDLWCEDNTIPINDTYPIPAWLEIPPAMIAAPTISPASMPYADPMNITASAEDSSHTIYYTTDGTLPTAASTQYTNAIPLTVDNSVHTLFFRSIAPNGAMSAPVRAIYNAYTKLTCDRVIFSAVTSDGSAGGPIDGGSTLSIPPLEIKIHLACPTPGAWMTYTSDGSEPTEQSTRYIEPFDIPGNGTIRARAFYPPGYNSGSIESRSFTIIKEDAYKARLTLYNATKRAGTYWSETFRVVADPAPHGQCFSHWLVTGPLVLDETQARASDMTFQWLTKDAITLEAIYGPYPGLNLRIR